MDGSGKSTQITEFSAYCVSRGIKYEYRWSRVFNTPLIRLFNNKPNIEYENVDKYLNNKNCNGISEKEDIRLTNDVSNKTAIKQRIKAKIALIDLCVYYIFNYRIAKMRADVLICDRYIYDSVVDLSIHYPEISIENTILYKILIRLIPKMDYSVLLTINEKDQFIRLKSKGEVPPNYVSTAIKKYDSLAKNGNWGLVINSSKSIEEIHKEIINYMLI